MLFLKTFGLCLLITGALDALWLSLMTSRLYAPMMGPLLRADTLWGPAVSFYLILALGLTHFVILPALKSGARTQLIFNAPLYGLVTYGTYDLSAWAVIKGWSGVLSVIDMAWGVFISTATAAVAYFLLNLTQKKA
jgi:uncharacterized membrane protein